jgi:predicted nucleic acid-binding protein
VILIDSNIPMYLVGADHPNKEAAGRLLDRLAMAQERLVTDAEVFQEIIHRFSALRRPEAIQVAFDALQRVVDEVLSIGMAEVEMAKSIVLATTGLSARDALHIAVMQANDVDRILSFDRGFDRYPGIQRLS